MIRIDVHKLAGAARSCDGLLPFHDNMAVGRFLQFDGLDTTSFSEETMLRRSLLFVIAFALVLVLGPSANVLGQQSRQAPVPVGTAAPVGEYEITVIDVTPDAAPIVAETNEYNDPPAPGQQFFMARIGVVYHGTEPGTPWLDLNFKVVGDSAIGYSGFDSSCGLIPEEVSDFSDLFQGASIEFNTCWAVAVEDVASLAMYVEPVFSFDDDPVWFSLGNTVTGTPAPVATAADAATSSSREAPLPVGASGVVDDYIVTVVHVDPDASDEIVAANPYNDPAAPGKQFYMATVSVTYTGAKSGTPWIDLDFRAVGDSAVGYTTFDNDCGAIPNSGANLSELFPGGQAEYNVCWEIDAADAASLVMYAQPLFSFDAERMWFAVMP